MPCPACQHQNRPQANFCEKCGGPLRGASPVARSHADDLKAEVDRIKQALTEAYEQHTAAAEILRVISSSPTDIQPVFAAVLRSAALLCDASDAQILQVDGDGLRIVAHEGPIPFTPDVLPMRGTAAGRAVLDRRTIHVADSQAEDDEYPESSVLARSYGFRTMLNVPLLRGAEALGAVAIRRTEMRPFTDRQIALLQTFADQAVIAIENVRLFTELGSSNRELTKALERQTATAEVLKVINRSAFELQPVLDTLVENATRLCGAHAGFIFRQDGGVLRLTANHGAPPDAVAFVRANPLAPGRGSATGRAALERRTIHLADTLTDPEFHMTEHQRQVGFRTTLAVPMLRESALLGVFFLWKTRVEPFTGKQIDLVTTFADQAVIAIENVRLFTELQEKTRAVTEAHAQVTEALEQQTATSEILRVIASSPTDVQPVFDAMVTSAARLCEATFSVVFLLDNDEFTVGSVNQVDADGIAGLRRSYPRPVDRGTSVGRAVLDQRVVHIADVRLDPAYTYPE